MCFSFSNKLFFLCLCRFRPRILIDVSKIDLSTSVLGFNISMPIMIAPTAMQKMAHPDGIYTLILFIFNPSLMSRYTLFGLFHVRRMANTNQIFDIYSFGC